MRQKQKNYPTVETLPVNALTVKEYAASQNITTSYVYVKLQRGKANFQIVTFRGINFIIP